MVAGLGVRPHWMAMPCNCRGTKEPVLKDLSRPFSLGAHRLASLLNQRLLSVVVSADIPAPQMMPAQISELWEQDLAREPLSWKLVS